MFDRQPVIIVSFKKQKQENICHVFLRFQHIFSALLQNNHHLLSVRCLHSSPLLNIRSTGDASLWVSGWSESTGSFSEATKRKKCSAFHEKQKHQMWEKSERMNQYVGWNMNISSDDSTGGFWPPGFMISSRLFRSRLLFWSIGVNIHAAHEWTYTWEFYHRDLDLLDTSVA